MQRCALVTDFRVLVLQYTSFWKILDGGWVTILEMVGRWRTIPVMVADLTIHGRCHRDVSLGTKLKFCNLYHLSSYLASYRCYQNMQWLAKIFLVIDQPL